MERARLVLGSAEGESTYTLSEELGVSRPTIQRWLDRYLEAGIAGLEDRPRSGRPRTVTPRAEARAVHETLHEDPPSGTHWSTRVHSDTSVTVGTMDMRPDRVGFPFHNVGLRDGLPTQHFGSPDGRWNAAHPFATVVVMGKAENEQSVWKASPRVFRFEEWATDGRLLRTVEGDFDGIFGHTPDDGPPVLITDFAVDRHDRLRVMTNTPDPLWRQVPRHGSEALVMLEDADRYFDSRVDIFDLASGRHLGFHLWDEAHAGLVLSQGEVLAQKVIYDDQLVPRVGLFRLEFR